VSPSLNSIVRMESDALFLMSILLLFDGGRIPAGCSAVVEFIPSLRSQSFTCDSRNSDQHDAYSVTAWLRNADGLPIKQSTQLWKTLFFSQSSPSTSIDGSADHLLLPGRVR
jgi:hypothetical protein